MNQNQLFQQVRWRLASWYAGVMGVILGLSAFGLYEAIAHAHWITLDRELSSVAGTLHDSLEPVLKQPGILSPDVRRFLPDLCLVDRFSSKGFSLMSTEVLTTNPESTEVLTTNPESTEVLTTNPESTEVLTTNPESTEVLTTNDRCRGSAAENNPQRHAIGAVRQPNYSIRLIDRSGNLIAWAGTQLELPPVGNGQEWRTFVTPSGIRYRHFTAVLHTKDNRDWGYLQLGRSLQDWDRYLSAIVTTILIGLPLALLLVGAASWWLAGLAMQPIYQSYRQIQQFTADAAHELRTPLAAIRATVESTLRLDRLDEAEARDTLKTVNRQNHRLSQLVKDLLLLSRMDRQTLAQKQHPCNLPDIISDIEEELAVLAMKADVTLIRDIRIKDSLFVTGDEQQLYRMVYNLVSNAIQYSNPGAEVKEVRIMLDRWQQQAVIQVKDTGIGIAAEDRDRIFDRFYRVSSDRARSSGGAGLGLSIARAIVQNHNGSIEVESKLGQGSIFTIQLPLNRKG